MHSDNSIINHAFSLGTLVSKTFVHCHLNFLLSRQSLKCSFKFNDFPFPYTLPFQSSVECLRENLYSLSPQSMSNQLEALVERTEDFTDSAYTSHEQRQAILGLCQLARQDTQQLVHAWVEAVCLRKQARLHRRTYAYRNIIIIIICYHMKNNNECLICETQSMIIRCKTRVNQANR